MKSDLLPHDVTYYRLLGTEDGEPVFRRTVLSPVRVCPGVLCGAKDGEALGEAVLYLFPDEIGRKTPFPNPRTDYFIPGICGADAPGIGCYRVKSAQWFDGIDRMKHFRVVGVGGGEREEEDV